MFNFLFIWPAFAGDGRMRDRNLERFNEKFGRDYTEMMNHEPIFKL